mmetsp:Transcript_3278/g.6800  ORF Transcript_3278/g.6800 Transcript_3278/m.6800 type:complete len:214 (-) Transcript_3278:478-1119(-)
MKIAILVGSATTPIRSPGWDDCDPSTTRETFAKKMPRASKKRRITSPSTSRTAVATDRPLLSRWPRRASNPRRFATLATRCLPELTPPSSPRPTASSPSTARTGSARDAARRRPRRRPGPPGGAPTAAAGRASTLASTRPSSCSLPARAASMPSWGGIDGGRPGGTPRWLASRRWERPSRSASRERRGRRRAWKWTPRRYASWPVSRGHSPGA